MKKYILIVMTIFLLANSSFADGQMRACWVNRFIAQTSKPNSFLSNYLNKVEALKCNTIVITTGILFDNRYRASCDYDVLIDSIDGRGFDIYLSFGLHMENGNKGIRDILDVTKWAYHPMNMTDEQFNKAVHAYDNLSSSVSYREMGQTSTMDKSSPYVRDAVIKEVIKYCNEYPEIDGVSFDFSRGQETGLMGWSQYTRDSIQALTNLDTVILKDSVYGAFPLPFTRNVAYSPNNLDDGVKSLATWDNGHPAIILKDYGSGYLLSFRANHYLLEFPAINKTVQIFIDSTDYSGDSLFVVTNSTSDNSITFKPWGASFAGDAYLNSREWIYAMGYKPIEVKWYKDVPVGVPVITGGMSRVPEKLLDSLQTIANNGSVIIDFCSIPQASICTEAEKDSLEAFLGYGNDWARSYKFITNDQVSYMNLTSDGRDFGLPVTNMTIDTKLEKDRIFFQYTSNEVLGGVLQRLKKIFIKRYNNGIDSNRKKVTGCVTGEEITKVYQGQDMVYWANNGYADFHFAMLYENDLEELEERMLYPDNNLDDPQKYIPLIHLYKGKGPETNTEIKNFIENIVAKNNKLGYGFFAMDHLNNDYTISDCEEIANTNCIIEDALTPPFNEVPIIPTGLRINSTPSLSYDISNFNNQKVYIDSSNIFKITISNTGESKSFLNVVDVGLSGVNNSVDIASFILEAGQSRNVEIAVNPSITGEINTELVIHSNNNLTNDLLSIPITLFSEETFSEQTDPVINVSSNDIIFATTAVGDTINQEFFITNTGSEDLLINNHELLNQNQFSLSSMPGNIISGDTQYVQISFHPQSTEIHYGELKIYNNDPAKDSLLIDLSGEGALSPSLQINIPSRLNIIKRGQ